MRYLQVRIIAAFIRRCIKLFLRQEDTVMINPIANAQMRKIKFFFILKVIFLNKQDLNRHRITIENITTYNHKGHEITSSKGILPAAPEFTVEIKHA